MKKQVFIDELSERLGIRLSPSGLLQQCFVHKSVVQDDADAVHNERLEFLGDSIIGQIAAEWLYTAFPDRQEGELTKMKAAVVSEPSLAKAAARLRLGELIVVGEAERDTGLTARAAVLCDVFEALTAAIYLSTGSRAAKQFVLSQLGDILAEASELMDIMDPKSLLQERTQSRLKAAPEYVQLSESGPAHDRTFRVSVRVNGRCLAEGEGKNKKAAEKESAAKALKLLEAELSETWDVCVVGAGLAGVSAAVAAARTGASVLVCERLPYPGGLASAGLVSPFMTHKTSDGRPLVGGLFEEIKKRLREKNAIRENCFDSEQMKQVLTDMMNSEANLTFCPSQRFITAGKLSDGTFILQFERRFVRCRRVIDASGDGVCARELGAEAALGDDEGNIQAVSLMFDAAGVDIRRTFEYIKDNPGDFLFPKMKAEASAVKAALSNYGPAGFYSLVRKAKEERGYDFPGDMIFFLHRKSQGARYDAVVFNQTHASLKNPESEEEKALVYAECERQMRQVLEFLREYVPGFEKCYLLRKAEMLGIRESWRIMGSYVFSDMDVAGARKHNDCVCRLAYPVDVHSASGEGYSIKETQKKNAVPPPGDWYEIPYRCLTVKNHPNVLVCGKNISATHEGIGAARIMPAVIATGQAAGAAAALSLQHDVDTDKLEYRLLKPFLAVI